MIISCPKCGTKYKIKDELINPEGTKLKCTKCGHVFLFVDKGKGQGDEDIAKKEMDKFREEVEKQVEKTKISLEEPFIKRIKVSKKTISILLGGIVIVLFGLIGWNYYPQIKNKLPFFQSKSKIKQKNTGSSIESIKNIVIQDVKQYFVDNEKEGKILVIEGKVVNKFNKPKELIKLEATLYDSKGKVLAKKEFLCGNKVSLFQLQSWSKKHLEEELNSKVGILMKNTNIQPGGSVDFMVLFFNPPQNIAEYGIKVIEAMDVEKK